MIFTSESCFTGDKISFGTSHHETKLLTKNNSKLLINNSPPPPRPKKIVQIHCLIKLPKIRWLRYLVETLDVIKKVGGFWDFVWLRLFKQDLIRQKWLTINFYLFCYIYICDGYAMVSVTEYCARLLKRARVCVFVFVVGWFWLACERDS